MAQYKVPQDVEADDKLVGPFTFRQLLYLFIAAGLIAIAVLLFNIFPLLAVIPVPFVIFLLILCNPFKKDQPMEVYLAALINFYLKPNKRFWNPGQRESTITITAPKKIEGPRIRAISEDEASHRLSFLADIVDSNGESVRNENWSSSIQEEYLAEASSTPDMFDTYDATSLTSRVANQTVNKHAEAIEKMREAIAEVEGTTDFSKAVPTATTTPTISHSFSQQPTLQTPSPTFSPSSPSIQPSFQPSIQPSFTPTPSTPVSINPSVQPSPQISQPAPQIIQSPPQPTPTIPQTPLNTPVQNPAQTVAFEQLAKNNDYTVATIAKEANRIQQNENDTYISLH